MKKYYLFNHLTRDELPNECFKRVFNAMRFYGRAGRYMVTNPWQPSHDDNKSSFTLLCPIFLDKEWLVIQKLKGNYVTTFYIDDHIPNKNGIVYEIEGNKLIPTEKIL